MATTSQNLQINLSLDEGLKNAWDLLREEYSALDRPAILRLAINNLAKEVKKDKLEFDMKNFFEELKNSNEGLTEKEVAKWWNKNKDSI